MAINIPWYFIPHQLQMKVRFVDFFLTSIYLLSLQERNHEYSYAHVPDTSILYQYNLNFLYIPYHLQVNVFLTNK